jgi:hypothetical protein
MEILERVQYMAQVAKTQAMKSTLKGAAAEIERLRTVVSDFEQEPGWREYLAENKRLTAERVDPVAWVTPTAYAVSKGKPSMAAWSGVKTDSHTIPLYAAPTPPTNTDELREAARRLLSGVNVRRLQMKSGTTD